MRPFTVSNTRQHKCMPNLSQHSKLFNNNIPGSSTKGNFLLSHHSHGPQRVELYGMQQNSRMCTKRRSSLQVMNAAVAVPAASGGSEWSSKARVAALALVTAGVANRLLYKIALVPMGDYVFFLAQSLTVAYVGVYATVLWLRYRRGLVTPPMLQFARDRSAFFLGIGLMDTASQLLGLLGAASLPGILLPLYQQTFMLWQLLFGRLLLGRIYSVPQLLAVLLVIAGASTAAVSARAGAAAASWPVQGVPLIPSILFLSSMLFPALVTVAKERMFKDAEAALNGKPLDIFVVNTFASLGQMVCTLAALPLLATLQGVSNLGTYVLDGWHCFLGGTPSCGGPCQGAPLLPVLYVGSNLLFNVLALWLLRAVGSVNVSLSIAPVVPLTVAAFAVLPLPLLPASPPLRGGFLVGVGLLCGGLALWNSPAWLPKAKTA